jgi:hypothetical protein
MHTAIVIPVGGGRLENLTECLLSLGGLVRQPDLVVLVGDGEDGTTVAEIALDRTREDALDVVVEAAPKHEPGMDQPRNRGVRRVQEINQRNAMLRQGYQLTHVLILDPGAYTAFEAANEGHVPRVMIGPYDWMPEHVREPMPDLHNDPRWPSFEKFTPDDVFTNDLSAGLACFSGNLVWPIADFVRIGGFWNELHHGRCEDGELGLRAVACGIPISYVPAARAWHQGHPINYELTLERNTRDVPMLNQRHPWVEGQGLFVVEEDGKRFNVTCRCGWSGNTAEIWAHQAGCEVA